MIYQAGDRVNLCIGANGNVKYTATIERFEMGMVYLQVDGIKGKWSFDPSYIEPLGTPKPAMKLVSFFD